MAATSTGTKVYGYDLFNALVEFWQSLIDYPNKPAKKWKKYFPLPRDKFFELQQCQTKFKTKLQRAAVDDVLNRSSFSGSTLLGAMSPHHPRFKQSSINRLRDFFNLNIKIKDANFQKSPAEHWFPFTYLNPPYLINSSLYAKKGDAHRDFDHF